MTKSGRLRESFQQIHEDTTEINLCCLCTIRIVPSFAGWQPLLRLDGTSRQSKLTRGMLLPPLLLNRILKIQARNALNHFSIGLSAGVSCRSTSSFQVVSDDSCTHWDLLERHRSGAVSAESCFRLRLFPVLSHCHLDENTLSSEKG